MKRIAAVTVSRADAGILRPILRAAREAGLLVDVIAAGQHLSGTGVVPEIGDVAARAVVSAAPAGDRPIDIAHATARGLSGFADAFATIAPELVLLIGDRFETLAAAAAAVTLTLPIGHVHGGELSEGAIDEQIRHAITKLSQLHFVASDRQARRVLQMGEEAWRVVVSGAPGLDNLRSLTPMPAAELGRGLGMVLAQPPILVTYHPETLASADAGAQVDELLAALEGLSHPIVITAPNVDAGNAAVRRRLSAWAAGHTNVRFVEALGAERYWSLMMIAAAMVGNSSSGIIEAASVGLPVVDVGDRQKGRDRGANVLHSAGHREPIREALARALAPAFRESIQGMTNPYGDGRAAPRIVDALLRTTADRRLLTKRFAAGS